MTYYVYHRREAVPHDSAGNVHEAYLQFRCPERCGQAQQNPRCGFARPHCGVCHRQYRHNVRIHIHCEVSEKRTPHGCARNGAELHQVLHRSVPVLSGQSGGFAGQADSRDEREILYGRPRLAGSGVRREHEGHQPHS